MGYFRQSRPDRGPRRSLGELALHQQLRLGSGRQGRSFYGDADLRLYGTDFRLRRSHARWQLETATHLFYLHGSLSTTSRERRKFNFFSLFFPKEHRAAGTFGATVLDLDVQIEYQFSSWSLRYSVAQIFPLHVRSSFAAAAESGEDKRGGRQQQFCLTYTPTVK